MKKIRFLILFLFVAIFFDKSVYSENDATLPSLEGEYGEWKVFTIEQNGQTVCYTTSIPKDMSGNHQDDRNPYIMVTLFGKVRKEVSIVSGYFYRPNSIVNVSIDGIQERFIAESDTVAWVEKYGSDKRIIDEMINGFKLLVFSESNEMTYSVDTYSLSGFKKAFAKVKELCS